MAKKLIQFQKYLIMYDPEEHPHLDSISGYIDTGFRVVSFIKYKKFLNDSDIAYDFPEILSKAVKNKLRVILNGEAKMFRQRGI